MLFSWVAHESSNFLYLAPSTELHSNQVLFFILLPHRFQFINLECSNRRPPEFYPVQVTFLFCFAMLHPPFLISKFRVQIRNSPDEKISLNFIRRNWEKALNYSTFSEFSDLVDWKFEIIPSDLEKIQRFFLEFLCHFSDNAAKMRTNSDKYSEKFFRHGSDLQKSANTEFHRKKVTFCISMHRACVH